MHFHKITHFGYTRKTYARPSLETLYSVGLVISHVLGMDLRGVSIEGGVHHPPAHLQQQQQITAGKKRDPSLQTLDGVYQSLKLFTYRSLRQDLYPFLRLAMENWSRDESLGDVVELWLAYITPWTVFGDAHFSDAWYVLPFRNSGKRSLSELNIRADYVRDNFLFYTALLSDFVQAAKKFDLYAAVRPLSRSARSSKTSCYRPTRLIDMVDAVLKVFSDERLLRHLQVMETALSSLEAYTAGAGIGLSRGGVSGNGGGGSTLGTPLRSTTPLRLHPSTLASGDRGYSNCGPLLRTQIQALEGKTGYTPVFIIGAEGSAFANDV